MGGWGDWSELGNQGAWCQLKCDEVRMHMHVCASKHNNVNEKLALPPPYAYNIPSLSGRRSLSVAPHQCACGVSFVSLALVISGYHAPVSFYTSYKIIDFYCVFINSITKAGKATTNHLGLFCYKGNKDPLQIRFKMFVDFYAQSQYWPCIVQK